MTNTNTNTSTNTMTNTNTTKEFNPFHSLKFSVSESMANREYVEIDYYGNKSEPFKIKAGTKAEFFLSHSAAMKAANCVIEAQGDEVPMQYLRLEELATGSKWHYLEIL